MPHSKGSKTRSLEEDKGKADPRDKQISELLEALRKEIAERA